MMRLLAMVLLARVAFAADYPPLKYDHGTPSPLVQRTMKALATSTKEKPNTVRILFYGQSITEQKWTDLVLKDLKERFPTANIQAENRALAGFSSQLLVHTAETDLYPFQPDLLVFHVYGAHNTYEDIIRRTRERTSAEILMQTDHVTKPADFTEETDANKLKPDGKIWDAFMNHKHLPEVAKKYQAAICDQRAMWKHYLKENKLEPKALLSDNVHLNAHGEFLMAECVKASLRYDPECKTIPAEAWRSVVEVETNKPIKFTGVAAELMITKQKLDFSVEVDGKKPSEHARSWIFTRMAQKPGGKWPLAAGFLPLKPLEPGSWLVTLSPTEKAKVHHFTVKYSKDNGGIRTLDQVQKGLRKIAADDIFAEEGSGTTDKPFTTNSGAFTIQPEHWNVQYALALAGTKQVPKEVTGQFDCHLNGMDSLSVDMSRHQGVKRWSVVNGLPNEKHTIEFKGEIGIGAKLLIHSPPPPPAK